MPHSPSPPFLACFGFGQMPFLKLAQWPKTGELPIVLAKPEIDDQDGFFSSIAYCGVTFHQVGGGNWPVPRWRGCEAQITPQNRLRFESPPDRPTGSFFALEVYGVILKDPAVVPEIRIDMEMTLPRQMGGHVLKYVWSETLFTSRVGPSRSFRYDVRCDRDQAPACWPDTFVLCVLEMRDPRSPGPMTSLDTNYPHCQ